MKKSVFNVVMTGALSLGVLGAASLPVFAASNSALDSSTQAKVDTIMSNLRTKLEAIGVDLPERGDMFANLDEETKAKAEAIVDKKKAGVITEEEAKTQLEALGVQMPERGEGKGIGHLAQDVEDADLNESTQKKADNILAQEENGTITHDEAEEQLAALGIEINERGGKGGFLSSLDEETKAKAEAILEKKKNGTLTEAEAKKQLQALGITLPERPDLFADLDDETKAKAEAIMEKLKSGDLTREQADEQLEALGADLPKHGRHGGKGRGDMLQGLDDETKAKAESLIEDAETQLEDLGVDKMPLH
ncbi:hypothetical protein M3221_02335 [Domibacillus indicus]|uniref:hypothetical protein n=1 Tax=Domibacillus indicus TaxID=1437523 RepID=UPI00203D29A6|nr:hypothetical protein [Domibacillus indicus]MCM3787253.1 hypothetical protein [Domibacillus indicus]